MSEASAQPRFRWLDWAAPAAAMLLHLSLAVTAQRTWGISPYADPARASWDYFWQTLPASQLTGNLGEAFWYLHTQPPLFNLWGALFLRSAGENVLTALTWANTLLAAMVVGMSYTIGRALGLGRVAATIATLLVAMLPSLLLYEVYPLYEMLSLFLLMAAVWSFGRRTLGGREGWLLLGVAATVALALTRSSFHLLLPLCAVGLAALASSRPRPVLLWGLILCLPLLLWSGKNWAQFGFFGAGSWGGMNIWRVAAADYTPLELAALAEQGVISPMAAQVKPFSPPAAYRPFGYTASSSIAVLNEEDFGNLAMIAVAAQYGVDARSLIAHNPGRALRTVLAAQLRFHRLPSSYDHLEANRLRLPVAALAIEGAVYGLPWLRALGSISVLLYPLSLLLFTVWWWLRRQRLNESLRAFTQNQPAAILVAGLLVYVVLVSSLFEYGENERFRFVVEPLQWLFLASMVSNLLGMRHTNPLHVAPSRMAPQTTGAPSGPSRGPRTA